MASLRVDVFKKEENRIKKSRTEEQKNRKTKEKMKDDDFILSINFLHQF